MNKNFRHKILAGAMLFGFMFAGTSCQDNEEGIKATPETPYADKTLYEVIVNDPDLTDFVEVINACGAHCADSLFNHSRVYTVWAPVNGTFNKDSIINETVADSTGNSNRDIVFRSFVEAHIANHLVAANGTLDEKNTVLLLNNKNAVFTGDHRNGYTFSGIALDPNNTNIRVWNGLLHKIVSPSEVKGFLDGIFLRHQIPGYRHVKDQLGVGVTFDHAEIMDAQPVIHGMQDPIDLGAHGIQLQIPHHDGVIVDHHMDTVLLKTPALQIVDAGVAFEGVFPVIHFHMDAGKPLTGAIVVNHQIVVAQHLLVGFENIDDLLPQFGRCVFSQQGADGIFTQGDAAVQDEHRHTQTHDAVDPPPPDPTADASSTAAVDTTSLRLSAAVARRVVDWIFLPRSVLNRLIHSFTAILPRSTPATQSENSVGVGFRILPMEVFSSSKPMTRISAATARPDRYSYRA